MLKVLSLSHGSQISILMFTTGTQVQNTVCETCKPGSFSAVKSSTAACVDHTDCATSGQRVALRGSEWHDNICMSCEEQKANGKQQY